MNLEPAGQKILSGGEAGVKALNTADTSITHNADYVGEMMSIKSIISVDMGFTLLITRLFINSFLEEDAGYRISEVVQDKLLGTLDYEVRNALLPDQLDGEIRLWGYKKIIVGSLRALTNVDNSARKRLFGEVVDCAFRYAAKYFPEQMKDEKFFTDLFGDI